MANKLAAVLVIAFGTSFAIQANAEKASPARDAYSQMRMVGVNPAHPPAKTINVLLLKSWGTTTVWEDLKTNWSKYGKIPLNIDDTTYIDSDFTYQDLVASKANVIVLSNPAGGIKQYSSAEMAAVLKYQKKGHAVIGTYLVLQYSTVDNRALAPAFGFSKKLDYSTPLQISNTFDKINKKSCLFKHITGSSWQSDGFNNSQVPSSGTWKGNLGKSKAQADADNYVGLISLYQTKTYAGISISNFPEYNGGTDDEQLLYNASVCYK